MKYRLTMFVVRIATGLVNTREDMKYVLHVREPVLLNLPVLVETAQRVYFPDFDR